MRSVAERLILRHSAAAKSDRLTAAQPERLTLRIEDFKIPLNPDGPIVINSNFRIWHESPMLARGPGPGYFFAGADVESGTVSPYVIDSSAPNRL